MASVVARSVKTGLVKTAQQVRSFSVQDQGHAQESMKKWITISKAAVAGCVVVTGINIVNHLSAHHEEDESVAYGYLKIRNKPFPWGCSDCSPFDAKCIKACKESA